MSLSIAITGKGGVGKTTLSALLVCALLRRGRGPVLAVDADPNSCLDGALGVRAVKTLGGVREEAREIAGKGMATGIAKQELLELKIGESLVEADGFDLIAMGRPEGAGCYCYANNVLKETIQSIARNYPAVVIDNEAGLENLSRRIVCRVDAMLFVTDPSQRGFETVRRLCSLAREMKNEYGRLGLVVNRVRGGGDPAAAEALRAEVGADFVRLVPDDDEAARLAERGRPLQELPANNPVASAVEAILDLLPGGPGRG